MKKYIVVAAVAMLAACSQQENTVPKQAALDTELSKVSYAIGLDVANSLKGLGGDIDRVAFVEAFNAQLDGSDTRLSAEEAGKAKQDFFQKRAVKQAEERKAAGAANKAKGEKFLAENAKKEGVTTTASGLQYEVLTMGDGAKPVAADKVKVHYRGTLLDGTEFDSSYKRGQPASFPLSNVIAGWTEGVQLMPVGSKFKFYIPSSLAYGDRGAGAMIAPNSALVFEVELLAIETEKAVEAQPAAK
ncbi:MAG: FKBP-type peptidyl-prolyl cis-trans isomerase [Mariprofundaceae bacterium]|nr:FKBP-type peptidyl-prolyl cis-trans isomerase [Mariprofundaceae bacterium]